MFSAVEKFLFSTCLVKFPQARFCWKAKPCRRRGENIMKTKSNVGSGGDGEDTGEVLNVKLGSPDVRWAQGLLHRFNVCYVIITLITTNPRSCVVSFTLRSVIIHTATTTIIIISSSSSSSSVFFWWCFLHSFQKWYPSMNLNAWNAKTILREPFNNSNKKNHSQTNKYVCFRQVA